MLPQLWYHLLWGLYQSWTNASTLPVNLQNCESNQPLLSIKFPSLSYFAITVCVGRGEKLTNTLHQRSMLKGVNDTLSNMDLHDPLQYLLIIPNTCLPCVSSFYLLNRPKFPQLLRIFKCSLVHFSFYVMEHSLYLSFRLCQNISFSSILLLSTSNLGALFSFLWHWLLQFTRPQSYHAQKLHFSSLLPH